MAIPARASQCGNSLPGPQIVSKNREACATSQPSLLPDEAPRWPVLVMLMTGCLGSVCGLLVLIGWHTGQIVSSAALLCDSVPVRYNAGLCFVFGGTALLLLARGRIGWARVAAAPMAAIGLLTLCEYLFNVNLGIDQLFFGTVRVAPSVSPRIAPNTAACFMLLGGAMLLTSKREGLLRNSLQALAAALVAALGLVGVIGYLADIPTAYGWGRFTPMAAPTAAMMFAFGLATISLAWRQYTADSAALPPWSPLVGGLTLAAGSAALWQALHVMHPRQSLDTLALVAGLLQAALLYLVVHLLRTTREGARRLRQLNSALQIQIRSVERAEGEVREKQAYTRSLIEASLDPLVTIAPDGKITDVNAATEAATGRSRRELIGTDFCDYFTEPEKARAGYQQAFCEGGVRDYALELRHRDGHLTPVLYNASVYHDQARNVIGVFAAARDITARKRTEQVLRFSEQRYRALLIATAQVVWATPPDGLVEDMPMWREYTGQTLEQVRGWGWLNAIHPDDRERTGAIWSKAVKTHGLYETEYRIRRADGQYRHFAIRGVPVLEDDGSIREWVGICTDIHERKQIEDELRKQAVLLNLAHDAILVSDLQSKISFWNRGAEETYGWSATEGVGRNASELLHTQFPVPLPEIQAMVQQQGEWEGELKHRTRDGRTIVVASRWSLQRDHHGAPASILEINRDITERKRLEQELQAKQAYTRSLIEASLDPLVTIAADGKITDVNRATEEVTGVSRRDLVGSDFCNYFTQPEKARAGYQQVFAEGLVEDYPLSIRHRSGRVTEVLYNASVFRNQAGEVEGVFAAARDITERKQLEDSLRQRTLELENSVAELEAFSYSVSHDLRAPLRSIDGFSQILLEDYRDKVDAEGQDSLRRIRNASQNMAQLIDALLQLSRVMRSELRREPVDLSVLALSTAAVVQKAEPARRVRFRVVNGLQASGDRRLLGVLLQNLLQNAWKFTARNSEPTIEFGSTQKDGRTAYYVRDNGIGFDMTYVNKLFTPFQRLHAKEQFEGTGIGLATVQRVIKRHGGKVWAEGAVDKGATFYFSLD
ncbi:MAG: PAS domain S-box protein [Acidobacteriota bacterium]